MPMSAWVHSKVHADSLSQCCAWKVLLSWMPSSGSPHNNYCYDALFFIVKTICVIQDSGNQGETSHSSRYSSCSQTRNHKQTIDIPFHVRQLTLFMRSTIVITCTTCQIFFISEYTSTPYVKITRAQHPGSLASQPLLLCMYSKRGWLERLSHRWVDLLCPIKISRLFL